MKIVFVTDTLSSGGSERVLSTLANSLCKTYEVSIVCLRKRMIAYDINPAIKLAFADDHHRDITAKLLWLRKYLRQYDLVIAFMLPVFVATLACMLFTRTPIIVSERNDPGKASLFRKIIRRMLLFRMQHMVVQTPEIKKYFPAKYHKRISVIANPISEQFEWQSALSSHKEKKIISVGQLDPQKNQKMMIDAFALFSKTHPDHCLDIYGEGPMRQELEEYIERKGCRVRLQGRSANIASQMKSAQVFVLSSDYEGMSNAMIEAMYLGLPVISTKVSGAKELIIDHINGCFADDANSIAQAFSYLSENETAAREIGLRASNTIKHLVDKNTVLQQWMDIIEKYTKL